MPLETVDHIDDLVISNPASTDIISQGDDHIRNIKKALENDINGFGGSIILSGVTSGGSEAYTFNSTRNITGYFNGMLVVLTTDVASAGSPTLNIDSVGSIAIIDSEGASPGASEMPARIHVLYYDGANFRLLSQADIVTLTKTQTLTNKTIGAGSNILGGVVISGGLSWGAAQSFSNQIFTNINIDSGTMAGVTIDGGLTWSVAQNFNNVILTNMNIDSGTITGITDLLTADGGSGRSSATAFGVITGGTTSTGAHQSVSTGTSGQVLTSNGAGSSPTMQTVTPPIIVAWARYNASGILQKGGGALSTGNASVSANRFTITFNTARSSASYGATATVNSPSDQGANVTVASVDTQTAASFVVETGRSASGYNPEAFGFTVVIYE